MHQHGAFTPIQVRSFDLGSYFAPVIPVHGTVGNGIRIRELFCDANHEDNGIQKEGNVGADDDKDDSDDDGVGSGGEDRDGHDSDDVEEQDHDDYSDDDGDDDDDDDGGGGGDDDDDDDDDDRDGDDVEGGDDDDDDDDDGGGGGGVEVVMVWWCWWWRWRWWCGDGGGGGDWPTFSWGPPQSPWADPGPCSGASCESTRPSYWLRSPWRRCWPNRYSSKSSPQRSLQVSPGLATPRPPLLEIYLNARTEGRGEKTKNKETETGSHAFPVWDMSPIKSHYEGAR